MCRGNERTFKVGTLVLRVLLIFTRSRHFSIKLVSFILTYTLCYCIISVYCSCSINVGTHL